MSFVRSIITSVVDGTKKLFSGSGRTGETFLNREYFQHYGLSSLPLPGAEAVVMVHGDHIIVIGSDDKRYRIPLVSGEVALYHYSGARVHLKTGGIVEISGATGINLGAAAGLYKLIDERIKNIFDNHVHQNVTSGLSNSGVPAQPMNLDQCATTITKAI